MQRKLAAIIAVDMVGFSRLVERAEEETIARQKEHRSQVFTPKFQALGGSLIKTTGDGYLVEFGSVVNAVRCAIDIQKTIAVKEKSQTEECRILYRIGLHLGDIIEDEGDVYGDGVNIAARLEALAPTAGICISGTAHEQLRGELSTEFQDMGTHQLKNISRPIQVFSWAGKPLPMGSPLQVETGRKPTVALEPFKLIGRGNDDGAIFAEGCNDALAGVLANFTGIDLVNRDARPEHLVTGSFQCAGTKVRTIVKIADTRNATSYLTSQFQTDITELFDAQDDLAGEIGSTVRYGILQREGEVNVAVGNNNVEALLNRSGHLMMGTVENEWLESEMMLDKVLEIDAENFMAMTMKAAIHLRNSTLYGLTVATKDLEKSKQLLTRATELNDHSDFVNLIWSLHYLYSNEIELALTYLNRGFEISPKFAQGQGILGLIQAMIGEPNEAIKSCEKSAIALAHNRIYHRFLGILALAHWSNGDYQSTIENAERAIAQVPDFSLALLHMASAAALSDKPGIAKRAIQTLKRDHPGCNLETVWKFPFKDKNKLDHYLEGLRKAGLPER